MSLIKGNTSNWEYVIGLEVHAQITAKSKLFSGAATEFGNLANSQVSLIDAAMPGMLPVLNEYCIHQAIRTGLGLNAKINKVSVFDRKNYFYPDLPQGYQISQFYHPIVQDGSITITLEDGNYKTIRINRLHIEQDAGKSIHDQSPHYSYVDLNRCGIALMEIVSEPDLRSPFEAGEYVKKLRSIVRAIGSCDGDMEKGSLRCDANVSVRRPSEPLGTRCEIKNINSIKNIIRAIEYEAIRQVELIENGHSVSQETRLFDADTGKTRTMRSKEEAYDYRYFPDPDLLPVIVTAELIDELRNNLPELPDAKIDRYIKSFGLSEYDACVIADDAEVAEYFEAASKNGNNKLIANWIISELFGLMNKKSITIAQCKITPAMLSRMVEFIVEGTISGKIAKIVFEEMFETGEQPQHIIAAKGYEQVSDTNQLVQIINEVLTENPESVIDYKNGKDKLFGFFVGQVMKKTKGQANPGLVNQLILDNLKNYSTK